MPSVDANRALSQEVFLSTPSVNTHEEPHPEELFCLPKCQCSQRGSFQGALLSNPSVDAYEEPPRGMVDLLPPRVVSVHFNC